MSKPSTPRRVRAAAIAACAVALAAACSPNSAQPGQLGDCVPREGGACVSPGGSGSSGGSASDDGGGICAAYADATACDACAASDCCTQLTNCVDSSACANLDGCETGCGGTTACITACQQQYPTGVGLLTLLFDCLANRCPVCAQSGVGDPCRAPFPPCQSGLTCSGDWCTRPCTRSADCAGLGTGGTNGLGEPNSCVRTSSGSFLCSPGCSASSSDCADFLDTYCQSTSSADNPPATVLVCAPLPDAAPHD